MVDPEKIKVILKYLNDLDAPGKGKWQEALGYHALIAAEIQKDMITSVPNSAATLKLFINTETGEVRSYLGKYFDEEFSTVRPGAVADKRASSSEKSPEPK